MANLPQNTTYGNSGTSSPMTNFSSISKLLQEKSQNTSADTFKSSLMAHYSPDTFSGIFGSPKPLSNSPSGVPIDIPAYPTENGVSKQPLPLGYSQFTPADEKGNWVNPSDQVYARNWPNALGGGQYAIDPTQPGAMVKSDRVIMDNTLNPGAKQKLLGNLSPSLYQVDHIIPLFLGGADTLSNLQILDLPTHEKKTAIQSVALTLLANKKIDLNEARSMAFTWADKDPSGLPAAAEMDKLGGYVPTNLAEKMAQKWKDDISKPNTMKYFGESFKENMSSFGKGWLPAPIAEFGKGLVGGGTAGIVPGTEATKESGMVGTIANTAGNILGTITGLGLLTKEIGAAFRGTKTLLGIGKAINIADEAMQTAGLATDIGNVTAKTIAAKSRAETLSKMASSAGLLSLWGQIGLTGKEVTGQVDAEFKNHVGQFFKDVAFGTLLGAAGQNVRGYATVGLGTASLSLMEGQDIKSSLQNAALMTALHGMGYKKGIIDPKTRIGNEEAYKMSTTTINKYLGDVIPTVKKGQPVPEVLNLDIPKLDSMRVEYQKKYPNDQRFGNLPTITNNDEAIHFIEQASRRELGNLIAKSDGTLSQEDIKKEMTRIITSKNQLYNQTLPPEARVKKEWADLVSMGEKLKPGIKTEQIRTAVNANDNLKKVPSIIPEKTYENTTGETFPIGKGGITGYGDKIDVEAKKNIDDFSRNPSKYDGKIYIPKTDAETAAIQRGVNFDYIANGKEAPTQTPEHTLRAFVRTTDGEFKPVGYMPQERSFDAKKFNLNMTYQEQINRFKHTIETAKTPEQLTTLFAKDKAGISIDQKTAEALIEKKGTLTDEEIYSLLKPRDVYYKLDSNLNNSNLWKKMDELGIDNLVIDPLKSWEINGARPRYNPDNPYLNVNISEQDWLRSMDLKNTPVANGVALSPEVKDLNTNIKEIVNKHKAADISQAIKNSPITQESTITPDANIKTPKLEDWSIQEIHDSFREGPQKQALKEIMDSGITEKAKSTLVKELYGSLHSDNMGNLKYYENSKMNENPAFSFDLVGFKEKNGDYGYAAGNAELKKIGELVKKYFPNQKSAIWGGDEGMIASDGISAEEAQKKWEQFRKELEDTEFVSFGGESEPGGAEAKYPAGTKYKGSQIALGWGETGEEALTNQGKSKAPKINGRRVGQGVDKIDWGVYNRRHNDYERRTSPRGTNTNGEISSFPKSESSLRKSGGTEKISSVAPGENSLRETSQPRDLGVLTPENTNEVALGTPPQAPISPVGATSSLETNNIPPTTQNVSNLDYSGKSIPIESRKNISPTNDFINETFNDIVHEIEYRKVKPTSPSDLEKIYTNVVESFKRKNPGLPESEFKYAMEDAKNRAKLYVQDLVNDTYKGTKVFGTEDPYAPMKTTEDLVKSDSRDVKLAKEFGLKLQEPNKNGIQYLELDRSGNPVFSSEYLKAHPKTNGSPLDVWGSFLGSELKANKAELSLQSKTWGKQIEQAKTSKSPYMRGAAKALDKTLSEKYGVKDPKTGEIKHDWSESWKLNSGLKKFKSLFSTKNEEGQLISQPFRRIMAEGSRKNYSEIKKDVSSADAKTRAITEKAKIEREKVMGGENKKPYLENGMRVKDKNQVQDVSEDLTPYDLLHSGLVRQEVRTNLIERYNNLREEMKSGTRIETRTGADGEKILGTEDEMKRLFAGIKKLSEYMPESKQWKVGGKIEMKNKGEPTFEEGVNDGVKIAAQIFKLNSSPGSVNFEKIKKLILESEQPKKDGSGGPHDGKGGFWGDIGTGIKDFIQHPFSSVTHYERPQEPVTPPQQQIDFPRLRESIKHNETGIVKTNPYSFTKPSGDIKLGNDNGAYQVTDAKLKERSKQFIGKNVTRKEFLANPVLQDQWVDGQNKFLAANGYTIEDILAAHRGGWGDLSEKARAANRINRAKYISDAMAYYNSHPPAVAIR